MSRARDVASRDIVNGSITNDDVNASAAIAASKLSGVVAASLVDAKGDLLAGSAADTIARLAVGTNGQVLTADSGETAGMKWADPAAGGLAWTLLNSGGTALSGSVTTITGISNADNIMVLVMGARSSTSGADHSIRFNSDSGANYRWVRTGWYTFKSTNEVQQEVVSSTGASSIEYARQADGTASGDVVGVVLTLTGGTSSSDKAFNLNGGATGSGKTGATSRSGGGVWMNSATISSVSILCQGTFQAGNVYVYTA